MSKETRINLIKKLQDARKNSFVICYITGTRQGLSYSMADDAVRLIYEHVKGLKKNKIIDLFLYSAGGAGTVPWRLINLLREFSKSVEVLVPYKAYSAATLTALGANKIVMHPMGELGPVDPKVQNEYNPTDQRGTPIGINVEDVASYIALIKEGVGIRHEDELVQAFDILAQKVHPLALGNVHRFYSQSRLIGQKLLKLHMPREDEHKINEIVDNLTSKLFYHGHPINRKEAKELNLKIEEPGEEVENLMWDIYKEYETELMLMEPFRPVDLLNSSGQDVLSLTDLKGVYVESTTRTDVFSSSFEITRPILPPNATAQVISQAKGQAAITLLKQGWKQE